MAIMVKVDISDLGKLGTLQEEHWEKWAYGILQMELIMDLHQ